LCKGGIPGLIAAENRPISGVERVDPNLKILLVDDDAELSAMLGEYLAAEGFETDSVFNGESGVDAALSGAYDAVVLDVMLPRLSGIDALRRIREKSRVPIIMLTAKGDNIDRVVGLEMGADDYVPKPCYPRELVARLRAVLRRTGESNPSDARAGEWLSISPPRNSTCSKRSCAPAIMSSRRMSSRCARLARRGRPMIAASMCISAISARNWRRSPVTGSRFSPLAASATA